MLRLFLLPLIPALVLSETFGRWRQPHVCSNWNTLRRPLGAWLNSGQRAGTRREQKSYAAALGCEAER
jgi:hypothetical protein